MNYIDFTKSIPTIQFPSIHDYKIDGIDQPLVDMTEAGYICESMYYYQGIAGAYKHIYLRESLAIMLNWARAQLPAGIDFKLWDGYRPICVQERLWRHYRQKVINEHKGENLTEEEIDFKTSFFVSKPSRDINHPSLHNTGGSIDLTLVTMDGTELNMGTGFDAFGDKAWTNHFEVYEENEEVRNNRRILYNVMIAAGFTNLPSEWWHYDYGTKFWGYFTENNALYNGILDADLPNRIPIM